MLQIVNFITTPKQNIHLYMKPWSQSVVYQNHLLEPATE